MRHSNLLGVIAVVALVFAAECRAGEKKKPSKQLSPQSKPAKRDISNYPYTEKSPEIQKIIKEYPGQIRSKTALVLWRNWRGFRRTNLGETDAEYRKEEKLDESHSVRE